MSMDDVGWYFAIWGRTAHAFRGEDTRVSVCGMSRARNIPAGRRSRCRRCTKLLGNL